MSDKIIPYLVKKNYVSNDQVQRCLEIREYYLQKGQSISLCQILVQQNFIAAEQLQKVIDEYRMMQTTEFAPQAKQPRFGRYVLKGTLGQGGMGTVYCVFDPQLRRDVALKVMNQSYVSEKQKLKFEREAVMMASLNHANIVRIFDYGQENGKPFITMEIVAGQPLSSYMRDLSLAKLVNILVKVCEAVHFAHAHGVIHRDLKPDNIMVTQQLEPKVMDFGLAKQIDGEKLSRTGEGAGTPLYMSPEQMGGGEGVDARSDVYSLGVILYEIMVGSPPFLGEQNRIEFEVFVHDPVPPCDHNKNLPKDLEAICLKAIAKKASHRYKTAGNFAQDLRNYLEGNQVLAKPFTWKTRITRWGIRHTKLLVTLFVIFGLMGIAIWQWQQAYKEKNKAHEEKIWASISSYEKDLTSQLILARLYTESLKYDDMQEILDNISAQQTSKEQQINLLIDNLQREDESFASKMRAEFISKKISLQKAIYIHKKYLPLTNFYRKPTLHYKSNGNYVSQQPPWLWRLTTADNKRLYLWKNVGREKWEIVGELPFIKSCGYAISRSGKYIAIFDTSNNDHTGKISIWKNENGNITPLRSLERFVAKTRRKKVEVLNFSDDERWLFISIEDVDCFILDLVNAKKYPCKVFADAACFSPDSKWVAYVDIYGGKVWNLEGKVPQERFEIAGGKAIHFSSEKIFSGCFDINIYNIVGGKITKETVLYDAHQAELIHLDVGKMFLASYSEDGKLQIWTTTNYSKVQKIDFHETTRAIMPALKNDMSLAVWRNSDLYMYNKKDSITEISFPQDPNAIKIPVLQKLAEYVVKSQNLKVKKDDTGKDYFTTFLNENRYIVHYIFPFLYVYDTRTNTKKNIFLFNRKKLSGYTLHKVEIFENYVIALAESTSPPDFEARRGCIVVWDLETKKIVFDKVYSNINKLKSKVKHMFAFDHRKIYKKIGNKIMIEKMIFSDNKIDIQDDGSFVLKSHMGIFKSAFFQDKIAYVDASDHGEAPKYLEIITKDNAKYFSQQIEVQLGRVEVIEFIKENVVVIGTITGKIAIVKLDTGTVKYSEFYRKVKSFFYDDKKDLLFVCTVSGLYIQPLFYDKADTLQSKFYPVALFNNYKIVGLGMSDDLKQIALSLAGGHTLLIDTDGH